MKRMAVFISGRGSNMEALLEAYQKGQLAAEPVVVITNNREAPGLVTAREHGVETVVIPWQKEDNPEEKTLAVLDERDIDFLVLAGFMRIITEKLIHRYPHRIINIHPSLLPAFPGLAGQQQALDYGVRYTGCTTHFVTATVDNGPIILQEVVEVLPDDTVESLSMRILMEEHPLLVKTVNLFATDSLTVHDGRKVTIDLSRLHKYIAHSRLNF